MSPPSPPHSLPVVGCKPVSEWSKEFTADGSTAATHTFAFPLDANILQLLSNGSSRGTLVVKGLPWLDQVNVKVVATSPMGSLMSASSEACLLQGGTGLTLRVSAFKTAHTYALLIYLS
jgi:hypothetical protein